MRSQDSRFVSEEGLPPLLRLPQDKALWQLAWPTIAIAVLRTAYGVIDSAWVGRLGSAELTAMAASSFAFWVLLIIGEVASVGVHAIAAVHEGSGQRGMVGEAVVQGLWFSIFCSLLSTAMLPLVPSYFRLLGTVDGQVLRAGNAYLSGLVFGVLPLTASGVLASGFKGIAKLRPVLVVNIICVLLNFVLDPLLIWGGMGLPAMGVGGAALATNVCALAATVISFYLLRRSAVPLSLARPNLETLKQITYIGLPMSVGGLLFTGVYVVLGRILSGAGASNLAALGLGHRIEALGYTVCEGFGAAAATIVAQWLGAGRAEEARRAAGYAARVVAWVMVPLSVLMLVAARPMVSLFTADPATISAAISYLQIVGVFFPLMGVEHVMDGALTGAGDTAPSLLFGFVFNMARIPMAIYFASRFGVSGVWWAISLTTAFKTGAKLWAFSRSRLPLLAKSRDGCQVAA